MLVNLGEVGSREKGYSSQTADRIDRLISPTYFKRQVQDVVSAAVCFGAKVNMPKPRASAAKAGLKFEALVLATLSKRFQGRFASGIPLSFQEGVSRNGFYQRPSTAIPDGLLLSADRRVLLVLEIKLRHSTDAWFQLNRFYLPILRRAIGDSLILRTLEICRYYDPRARLPEEKKLVLDLEEAFRLEPGIHPVLIWER